MSSIDRDNFYQTINPSDIFDKTYNSLSDCLQSWYQDDPEEFTENMGANLATVIDSYSFGRDKVYLDTDLVPPKIICVITITDSEEDLSIRYRAVYDTQLTLVDRGLAP